MKMSDNSSNHSDDYIPISIEQLIEEFEFYESDKIRDLYYDLKNRIPYFIDDMQFFDIFSFIMDNRFSQYKKYLFEATHSQLEYFKNEYCDEINTSLFVLNNFLKIQNPKIYKRLNINYQDWFEFCYNFTTIKKPVRYDYEYEFELPNQIVD